MKSEGSDIVPSKDEENFDSLEEKIERMYAQMQLPRHRRATEEFMNATAEDLNRTFRPVPPEDET
mgnify:CR=1 FL=1